MFGTLASAATLSPEEQLHVDAIGIHDLDVLADMEEHADETPQCVAGEHLAVARVVATCCGNSVLTCRDHLTAHIVWAEMQLVLGGGVKCSGCGRQFEYPTTVEEILREVPL